MKTYQYQILRFQPDRVTGEFINLGVVAFDPYDKLLKGKFYDKISRASSLFPTINSRFLSATLRFIQKEFDLLSSRITSEFEFSKDWDIEKITQTILPKDDSSIYFTMVQQGLDLEFNLALENLFERLVTRYVHEDEKEHLNDKDVWVKIYKKHFDELGISKHLHEHVVNTEMDKWKFEKAWKNGAWNCFETVSFDLIKAESIKDKVYKWAGRIDELTTTKEAVRLYLLSRLPSEHKQLRSFIKKKIERQTHKRFTIKVVFEEKARVFAKDIKNEIDKHLDEEKSESEMGD